MVSSINSAAGGASIMTSAGIEQLVKLSTLQQQQRIDSFTSSIEELEVKQGIYTDIESNLQSIQSAITDFWDEDSDSIDVLDTYKSSISGEQDTFTASVTDGDAVTTDMTFDVKVNQLAAAQRLATNAADAASRFTDGSDTEIVAAGDTATFSVQVGSGDAEEITLDASEGALTLRDLVSAINESDAGVRASVINDGNGARLVFESLETGAENTIVTTASGFADGDLDTALSLDGSLPVGNGEIVQDAVDAQVVINGITIDSSSNTLEDAIDGVSLTLTAESEEANGSELSFTRDFGNIATKFKALLSAVNTATSHLKVKTEPQIDANAEGDNPAYTPAALGMDYSMRDLRSGLTNDLLSFYSGAESGAVNNLLSLGVDVGTDNISLELEDEDAFTAALAEDFDGVMALFDYTLTKLSDRLDFYMDDTDSVIDRTQESLNVELDSLEDRKDTAAERLTRSEETYRKQYYAMQAQLLTMQYDFDNSMAIFYGSINSQA